MGGGITKPANKFVREVWKETFTMMELSDAGVRKLDNVFGSLVTGSKESVGLAKMLDILAIDKTRFNAKIFLTENKDNVRCIDFYAFVVSLWKFCCLEREALCKTLLFPLFVHTLTCPFDAHDSDAFVFEIYDTDCDGRISIEQIEKMFLELFGTKGLEQETIKQ
jgi:Ca2+-binding EF-hand superfamily protein